MRLLVAIQYWEGDRDDAMNLGNLIAQLELSKRKDVDVVFAHRFDSRAPDPDAIQNLREKFTSILVFKNKRKEIGWPDGCNALWLETINWACVVNRQLPDGKKWDAVLTWEGDDVPMRRDWINALKAEWESKKEPWIVGHFIDDPVMPHFNGNLMAHPNLPLLVPELNRVPKFVAWDTHHYVKFKPHGYDTNLVLSERFVDPIDFPNLCKRRTPEIALAYRHGVKDPGVKDKVGRILMQVNEVPADPVVAQKLYENSFS